MDDDNDDNNQEVQIDQMIVLNGVYLLAAYAELIGGTKLLQLANKI